MDYKDMSISMKAIHGGVSKEKGYNALTMPIYQNLHSILILQKKAVNFLPEKKPDIFIRDLETRQHHFWKKKLHF